MTKKEWSALLLILVILISVAVFLFRVKKEMVDFRVNYEAGKRMRAGETLYRVEDGHYQFKYPPFSSFLYLPLSLLPLEMAEAVWYGIVLVSSFLIFYLSFKLVPQEIGASPWLKVLPPLVLARYFLRELQLGQINALMTFLLLLVAWLLVCEERSRSKGQGILAGVLWGLASGLKPYALIYSPYLVLKNKWRALSSGLLLLGLAFVLPAAFYGWKGNLEVHREWLSSFSHSTPGLLGSQDNISLIGLLMKWSGSYRTTVGLYFLLVIFIAIGLFFLVRKGKSVTDPQVLDFSLILMAIPLVSPLGWDYTLLSSAPALVLIINSIHRYPKFWRVFLGIDLAIISFSIFDLLGRQVYSRFMSWSVITLSFLILAGYVAYLRIKNCR